MSSCEQSLSHTLDVGCMLQAPAHTRARTHILSHTHLNIHTRAQAQGQAAVSDCGVVLRNLEQEGMFPSQWEECHLIHSHGHSLDTRVPSEHLRALVSICWRAVPFWDENKRGCCDSARVPFLRPLYRRLDKRKVSDTFSLITSRSLIVVIKTLWSCSFEAQLPWKSPF